MKGFSGIKSRTANTQKLKLVELWVDGPIISYVRICVDPLGPKMVFFINYIRILGLL